MHPNRYINVRPVLTLTTPMDGAMERISKFLDDAPNGVTITLTYTYDAVMIATGWDHSPSKAFYDALKASQRVVDRAAADVNVVT